MTAVMSWSPTAVAPAEFARRFGARLVRERRLARRPLWVVATRSSGEMTLRDLRDAEAGLLPLDAATVVTLASLYGIPVREVLTTAAARRGLSIDVDTISLDGAAEVFRRGDAASLVEAYFRLLRTVRGAGAAAHARPGIPAVAGIAEIVTAGVDARRDDLERIADHLQGETTTGVAEPAGASRAGARDEVLHRVVALAELERRRSVGGALCAAAPASVTPSGG